jgi:DNA-binding NtrC family response regulator
VDLAPQSHPVPGALLLFSDRTPMFRPLTFRAGEALVLGRHDIGGVKVPDTRVSKEHLKLEFRAGLFHLEDLSSSNGSFLDGERFTGARTARPGALLRVAHTLLLLLDDVRRFLAAEVKREGKDVIVGPALQEAFDLAALARRRNANLLILGENGSGKELVAQAYHRGGSPKGPFVPVNSAAISGTLADGLLFGTRRGAFSDARDTEGLVVAADGGVLFLDEIVELSPEVQVRLLRAVQSGEVLPLGETAARHVEVRFVTASHQDLRARVADGRFREDLYHRLNQASVTVRPLRERREELAWLMELDCEGEGALPLHVTAVELALLRPWPGNLRELRSAVREAHAAAVHSQDTAVRARHFKESAGQPLVPSARSARPSPAAEQPAVEVAEPARTPTQAEVVAALEGHGGNVSAAAKQLELHRTQLYRLMKRYGLVKKDAAEPEGP